jgi:hypothetical protein
LNNHTGYSTGGAVESAIKSAANNAKKHDPSIDIGQCIRQAHFDRLLCRVFLSQNRDSWALKGGTGLLARIPNTRSTLDIDLYQSSDSLDQALDELRQAAETDLGDHFRFEYSSHLSTLDDHPYRDGYQVKFQVYVGVNRRNDIKVDLVIGTATTGSIDLAAPAYRLPLKLKTAEYRLYPIVDQVADKVCATMMTFNGLPSSRTKDLVDLVAIAETHDIEAGPLAKAIETERRRRGLSPFTTFAVPDSWASQYGRSIRKTPYSHRYPTIDDALDLMKQFIEPALQGIQSGHWHHQSTQWIDG